MNPVFPGLPVRELLPGELLVLERPAAVMTILGSCVSVTFHCRRLGVAAICHALLPEAPGRAAEREPFRYVDSALGYMDREFRRFGVRSREVEVKVFGGGDVLIRNALGRTIGARNGAVAFGELERMGYAVAACDVGGIRGRKLFFNAQTGEVFVKKLSRALTGG